MCVHLRSLEPPNLGVTIRGSGYFTFSGTGGVVWCSPYLSRVVWVMDTSRHHARTLLIIRSSGFASISSQDS